MAKTPQVLIIDENLDSRVETRKALQRAQLDIAGEVGQGAEAVTYARDALPDAILIAVEEPVTRPLETAESLANILPQTPVIFYSSLTNIEAARRALLAGARDYLTKPLQANRLSESIYRALELEEKRQMREAGQLATQAVRGTVITVTGAKGGIGKSVIAVNLALALRAAVPRKVAIVDADTQFGDVGTMLDIEPETTASDLFEELATLDRFSIGRFLTEASGGIQVLAGPPADKKQWEDAGPDSIRRILDLLSLSYDFVVVDTAGSFDRFTRNTIELSTLVLVVTTGEVSSILDTLSALTRMQTWSVPSDKVKIVLNRSARAEGIKVSDLERTFGQHLFWDLPRDKRVSEGVQVGQPVVLGHPASPAARSLLSLARVIGGGSTREHQNGARPARAGILNLRRRG